ncbi:uncharacterized protein VNE69_01056 [Vairimorpha necatrix]|uniref:Uncharacterized protein n=1 Tax=Vairimorpha necatrix TaxID=6039 RepID=A0AAX4J7Y2_9MICR
MTRMKTREEKEQLKKLFLCYKSTLDNHMITQLSYDILSKECDFDQNDLHNFLEAAIRTYNDIPYHNATHNVEKLNIIEFKMLIKIADVGKSYKKFKDFMCGSKKLEKEICGTSIGGAKKRQKKMQFILNYSLPLAECFLKILNFCMEILLKNKKNPITKTFFWSGLFVRGNRANILAFTSELYVFVGSLFSILLLKWENKPRKDIKTTI